MVRFGPMIRVLAAVSFIAGAGAPAGARTLSPVAGWDLNSTAKTCSMSSAFSDNVTIAFVWAPSTSELGFMAAVPPSYLAGAQQTAALELSFDGGGSYRNWQDDRATLIRGGNSVGVMGNWGATHAADLAGAMKAASHVHVRVAGRDLGSYDLAGSPAAYEALMRCGKELAGK